MTDLLEPRRTRLLLLHFERGEELPQSLQRALDRAEVKAGWISGSGVVEAAEIAAAGDEDGHPGGVRRIEAPMTVASIVGQVIPDAGGSFTRLYATCSRERDTGLSVVAGELAWARTRSLDLLVTAFDDLGAPRRSEATTTPTPAPSAPRVTPVPPLDAAMPAPLRTPAPKVEEEVYPEPGDRVSHFAFGDGEVLTSDGDRIGVRLDRDGHVRNVTLSVLRIAPPRIDAEGRRHFVLSRKN